MKVGLIIYGSIDTITGGYIYNKKLVEYLTLQGVEVKIFSQPYSNFFNLLKNNFSKKLHQEILQFAPDILLQDAMNFISLFIFNHHIKNKVHLPIISIVHLTPSCAKKNPIIKFSIRKLEKFYFKNINGYIFNSQATKKEVIKIIDREINNYIIAYPGKDHNKQNLPSIKKQIFPSKTSNIKSQNKLKIIFVGNVSYIKGLHTLLLALIKIDLKFWHLTVIGSLHNDHRYVKKINHMITLNHLESNVNMLGLLESKELYQQLNNHDILAVPSYYESFGLVYAEAMGAGLPVIASQSGGGCEFIIHGENGFLIKPGDINTISDAILKLILNEHLLFKMSINALLTYKTLASWHETLSKIHQFLNNEIQVSAGTAVKA